MLTLLSPAKKQDIATPAPTQKTSMPACLKQTHTLVQLLKTKSAAQLGQLMSLSPALSALNYERYQAFDLNYFGPDNAKPALFAFQGEAYHYLDAATLSQSAIEFSQTHLGFLSGLYGLLRPLDLIQAYRLEMNTKITIDLGKTLYAFWKTALSEHIKAQISTHKNPILINLASQEYFKALDAHLLKTPIITIEFKQKQGDQYKSIGILAKRARGAMARFIIENKIDTPEALKNFSSLGYQFSKSQSNGSTITFLS